MTTYTHPRPALTADIALLAIRQGSLHCLLISRRDPPFAGRYALPGGFVEMGEGLEAAAKRELHEETGVRGVYLEQLYTFGAPKRDPRGRVVTVAYYALVDSGRHPARASSDAAAVRWFPIDRLPPLAFDHDEIIAAALERLRAKVNYTTAAFELLPEDFTLEDLHRVYTIILGRPLDRRNFRKKILALGILRDTGRLRTGSRSRPGRLYTLKTGGIVKLPERGVLVPFDLEEKS